MVEWKMVAEAVLVIVVIGVGIFFAASAKTFDPLAFIESTRDLNLGDKGDISSQVPNQNYDSMDAENNELEHIFTAEGEAHDFSEIACLIGKAIYEDFSVNGDAEVRNTDTKFGKTYVFTNIIPAAAATSYYLDGGKFSYKGGTTDTSKESILKDFDPNCVVCGGATNLDEGCIGAELHYRTVDSNPFCGDTDSSYQEFINVGGNYVAFGNSKCPEVDNYWGGTCYKAELCNNKIDRIYWYSSGKVGNYGSEALEKWLAKSDDWEGYNSVGLEDGRDYVYGLFWVAAGRYDVVFSAIPVLMEGDLNKAINFFNWDYSTKFDVLGYQFRQARSIADFTYSPEEEVTVGSITGSMNGQKAPCVECDSDATCFPEEMIVEQEQRDWSEWSAGGATAVIKVFVDKSIGCSGKLTADKTYRITINKWSAAYDEGGWGATSTEGIKAHDKSIVIREYIEHVNPVQPTVDTDDSVKWTLKVDNSPESPTTQSKLGKMCVTGNVFGSGEFCTPTCTDCSISVTLNKNQPVTVIAKPNSNGDVSCIFANDDVMTGYCNRNNDGSPKSGPLSFVIQPSGYLSGHLETTTYGAFFY